ncbi:hypothetical protein BGZ76_006488 [Entomortierella beljakovae]|nr:hypothetical protein BGZ76_006488 [Entomortierella beljakovae]
MLPVIGVETRAVMRAKVVQVMQQVSSRLTDYESIRRVIRSAVDDAGLLMLLDSDHTVVTNERRGKKGTKGGIRRIHYKDSSEYYDNNDRGDDKYYLETKGSLEDENETSESVWGRLQDVLRSTPRHGNQESSGSSSRNLKGVIDESQIPVVADIAMGAVLDYVAEILTPALVIHQLTEGIQSSLYQISKDKDFDQNNNNNDSEDSNEQDLDIGALSSQSISLSNGNQHGLNHLSDDWVWSSLSSTTDGTDKSEADDDSKGQDEDLWDKDMEIHDWDSTGRLFEDFEDTDGKEELDQKSDDNGDLERENWDSIREEDDSDSTYEEYYPNPFAVGIQEDDRYQQEDQEEDDDSYDGVEDFEHDGSMMPTFSKQKRSIVSNDISTPKPKSTYSSYSESLPIKFSKRNPSTVILKKRRLDIAPDLRLESLLAQLVEPVLTTFIEDDFPSSCKRAQGELMDGIIWSLDQADSITSIGNEDQLVLLSELEY